MEYQDIRYEVEEPNAIVTIDRPERLNAFRGRTIEELIHAFKRAWADRRVACVIFTGAGERAFCVGGDQKYYVEHGGYGTSENGLWELEELQTLIRSLPKPVIAAVNGFALGGGCELAMSCHFRIMLNAEKVVMGQPEINVGIIPGWGGTQRLPRLVGKTRALEMLLLATRISAPEALSIGLVTRVSQPGQLMNDAKEIARALAKKAPVAVQIILDAVTRGLETTTDQGVKIELEGSQRVSKTKDAMEGAIAFIEKREPVFTGE